MLVDNVHISSKNKWTLVVEGIENNKTKQTTIVIPPTNGDRVDIITEADLEHGYRFNCKGVIIIWIKNGDVNKLDLIK